MQTLKIIMLGSSGAGKTVFLASLYRQLMLDHLSGISLTTDSYQQGTLIDAYGKIASKEAFAWPPPTAGFIEWAFTCRVTQNKRSFDVLKFIYFDYTGAAMRPPDTHMAQALDHHLNECHTMLGILDGRKILAMMDGKTKEDLPIAQQFITNEISYIIATMKGKTKPVHFVISKWDLLAEKFTLEQVRDSLYKNSPLFKKFVQQESKHRLIRLIPVSAVGMGYAVLQTDGRMKKTGIPPAPYQVELPLFCVMLDAFQARYDTLMGEEKRFLDSKANYTRRAKFGRGLALGLKITAPGLAWIYTNVLHLPLFGYERPVYLRLIQFLEHPAEFEAEQAKEELKKSLENVQDEQSAIQHAVNAFEFSLRDLEDRCPESKLSLQ